MEIIKMRLTRKISAAFAVAGFCLGLFALAYAQHFAFAQGPYHGWGMWGPNHKWHDHWRGPHMSPWHRHRMERHWRFMNNDFPDEYKNLENLLKFSTDVIEEGGKIYAKSCSRCHGVKGLGDGEAAKDLNPSPSLLAFLIQRPIAVDSYLMWTISEGGKTFESEMPAFKETLSREEIWKVISYMRAGFPAIKASK